MMKTLISSFAGEKWVALVFLSLMTFLVYANSLGNGFVWDDESIIVDNPRLSGIKNLPRLLLSEDTFPGRTTGYYRPFAYLSFFADRMIWGLNPFGFHLTNVLLHVGVSVCFYLLIRLISRDNALSLFSALIFALHPMNSETVNFLSGGRNTLLSALFMILSFIAYLKHRRLLSLGAFLISIFSKEFGLLLPFFLYVHDRTLTPEKKKLRSYLPYVACITVYISVRLVALRGRSALDFDIVNLPGRLMHIPEIITVYIKTFLLPLWLKVPYTSAPPQSFDFRTAMYMLSFVLLVFMFWFFRKSKIVFLSSTWFFLFLLPVLNLIPLGNISIAERYAYFSSMGLSVLLAFLLLKNMREKLAYPILALLLIFYSAIVIQRNPVWKSSDELYAQMITESPESSMGYYNMGFYYYSQGDTVRGQELLRKAIQKKPQTAESYHILAMTYLELDDPDSALPLALKAASLNPSFTRNDFLLARIYQKKGDQNKASEYLDRFRKESYRFEELSSLRAEMFCADAERFQEGNDLYKAEMLFRRALVLQPEFARALIGLGSVVAEKGHLDEAMGYFLEAAALEPSNPLPHYNLSLAYGLKGMPKEAEREMEIFKRLSSARHQ